MGEQAPIDVGEPTFGGAGSATPAQHNALRSNRARLRGDGPPPAYRSDPGGARRIRTSSPGGMRQASYQLLSYEPR